MRVLDTNVVVRLLKEDNQVGGRLRGIVATGEQVTLGAITYFEARRDLTLPTFARKLKRFTALAATLGVLPFDRLVLDEAVRVHQDLRTRGVLIEDADILIAATALAHDAVLVTHNTRHFDRITGLELEDWQAT